MPTKPKAMVSHVAGSGTEVCFSESTVKLTPYEGKSPWLAQVIRPQGLCDVGSSKLAISEKICMADLAVDNAPYPDTTVPRSRYALFGRAEVSGESLIYAALLRQISAVAA